MNFLRRLIYARRFKTGWIPDQEDTRDRSVRITASSLPPSFDYSNYCTLFRQQRQDCVSHANCGRLMAMAERTGVPVPTLSRSAHYYASVAEMAARLGNESLEGKDNGTFLRDFYRSANRYGLMLESEWPYSKGMRRPPFYVLFSARSLRGKIEYRRVPNGDFKTLLWRAHQGYFPAFGTAIGSDWYTNRGSTLAPPNRIEGYHAVYVVGWDSENSRVKIANSWGTSWGVGGFGWLDLDYLMYEETRDVWS